MIICLASCTRHQIFQTVVQSRVSPSIGPVWSISFFTRLKLLPFFFGLNEPQDDVTFPHANCPSAREALVEIKRVRPQGMPSNIFVNIIIVLWLTAIPSDLLTSLSSPQRFTSAAHGARSVDRKRVSRHWLDPICRYRSIFEESGNRRNVELINLIYLVSVWLKNRISRF